ncbi:ankyrin repeat-containing protein [[Candida] railenensis]|uniref:Ankyrin repeat-containing protein n=1 Tax=[Candida] railenensis TaxID=45579 RepID=A0A9P0QRT7_9ASCO|nr:ankyrin repeat-containing protein [[Candida] railenensis]
MAEPVTLPLNYSRRRLDNSLTDEDELSPLDRAYQELCLACRAGDLDTVDSLTSTANLNINYVDEWDYSPLILASLCGHRDIVELLLLRGAVCDRDTFEGARSIYGALNDEIRDLLISFDVSKKVDISQPFAAHISSLLNPQVKIKTRDITFKFPQVHGVLNRDYQAFSLNKFLLIARSPYFREKLSEGGDWFGIEDVKMSPTIDPAAFKCFVDYVYVRTDSVFVDENSKLGDLAALYKLDDLTEAIQSIDTATTPEQRSKLKNESSVKLMEAARQDMRNFLQNEIFGNMKSVAIVEEAVEENGEIDAEDISVEKYITQQERAQLIGKNANADIIVSVIDIDSESVCYYPVHKSILSRSPYFETMILSDIFNQSKDQIPVIQLSSSTSSTIVAEMVLSFLYHDDVENMPLKLTIDLLFAADELFLDRLKTMAAVRITSEFKNLDHSTISELQEKVGYNPYELIRVSWQTHSDRLEQHMSRFLAYNLRYIYENSDERKLLLELIEESADRIKDRQDTDTIELIDDIRYYLVKKYGIESSDFEPDSDKFEELNLFTTTDKLEDIRLYKKAVIEYERDIALIESLLEEVNLEA